MPQEKFHYKSLEEVKQRAAELGVDLPFAADTHALAQPLTVRNITFPNRLGIAPMEGADSTPEGAPTEYTTRRYVNEAIGGSSVIWFEAISIVEEGRSSQTQLLLTRDTLDEFKASIRKNMEEAAEKQAELEVASGNTAAIALYQKLGFQKYGTLPDYLKYASGQYASMDWMMKKL